MKKTYVKPELYFESFELSSNIASGCQTITKLQSKETACGYNDGVDVIFTSSMGGCNVKDDGTGKICYDVPSDSNRLFTS